MVEVNELKRVCLVESLKESYCSCILFRCIFLTRDEIKTILHSILLGLKLQTAQIRKVERSLRLIILWSTVS
jgi:hypothetical protein